MPSKSKVLAGIAASVVCLTLTASIPAYAGKSLPSIDETSAFSIGSLSSLISLILGSDSSAQTSRSTIDTSNIASKPSFAKREVCPDYPDCSPPPPPPPKCRPRQPCLEP
jgi:hypothetical protein